MLLRCRGTLGVAARALPHLRAWVAGPARSLPPTEAPTIAGGHRELTMSTDASGASAKKRRKKRPSPEVEAMKMRSLVPSVGDFPGGPGLGGAASLDGIASPSTSHTRRERFDGDLFYDRSGRLTRAFFGRLSPRARATPLLAAPGNHDLWVGGAPDAAAADDQYGNGFMQYYAQARDLPRSRPLRSARSRLG